LRIHVGYLPITVKQAEVKAFVNSKNVLPTSIERFNTKNGDITFYFLNFSNPDDASKAVNILNEQEFPPGNILQVNPAHRKGDGTGTPVIKGTNLYVQNVPNNITLQEVSDLFKSSIVDIGLRVKFASKADATKALLLNGTEFHGQTIQVHK